MPIVTRDLEDYIDHCVSVVQSDRKGIFNAKLYDKQITFFKECNRAYNENQRSLLFKFALKDFN